MRDGALAGLVLLAIMNAVGIYLNLYVLISNSGGYVGVFPALFASSAGVLHFLVAAGLFVGLLVMLVRAQRLGDLRITWLCVAGLLSFLVAAYSGYHFVYDAESAYSFTMEMGFLGVVLCEGGILFLVGGPGTGPVARDR
ncbi:MAG: hypothetical protein L3K08_07560 [Thermoplasmata archaeon]|nr:hypothetical protein [Thermoplasmata archaeon]